MTETSLNPNRGDPIMSVDGARFWRAADDGRFVAQKCARCSRLWHPPRAVCPDCRGKEWLDHELSGKGTVISWAMPVRPAAIGFEVPPIIILVQTEEGLNYTSNLEGVDEADVRFGMPVKVGFTTTRGGKRIPIFHAAGER